MEAQKEEVPKINQPDEPDTQTEPAAKVVEAPKPEELSIDSTTTESASSESDMSSMPSEGTVSPDDTASTVENTPEVVESSPEVIEGQVDINPDVLSPSEPVASNISKSSEKDEATIDELHEIDELDEFRNHLNSFYSQKTRKNKYKNIQLAIERNRIIRKLIDVLHISKKSTVKNHMKKLGNIRNTFNDYLNRIDKNKKNPSRKLSPSKKGGKTKKAKSSNKK